MIYKRSFYTVFAIVLVSAVILQVYSVNAKAVCPDGKCYTKHFSGDVDSLVGNVTLANGSLILFNAPLPDSDNATIAFNGPDFYVTISWTDWQGVHSEKLCTNDKYDNNVIPFPPPPKSGQTGKLWVEITSHSG